MRSVTNNLRGGLIVRVCVCPVVHLVHVASITEIISIDLRGAPCSRDTVLGESRSHSALRDGLRTTDLSIAARLLEIAVIIS